MSECTDNIYCDPVCKMTPENQDEFIAYDCQGDTYYFCSDHCLAKFQKGPETYRDIKECFIFGTILTVPLTLITYYARYDSRWSTDWRSNNFRHPRWVFCIWPWGLFSQMIAAEAMRLSSVSVVVNALRLKTFSAK